MVDAEKAADQRLVGEEAVFALGCLGEAEKSAVTCLSLAYVIVLAGSSELTDCRRTANG